MGVDLQKVDPLVPSYIDLEAEVGRVTLALPGPRDDAAYPSYEIIVRTNRTTSIADGIVSIEIKGDKNQSKRVPLIENKQETSSKGQTTSRFFLYGICPLGEVWRESFASSICACRLQLREFSIYFDRKTKWRWDYIIIYDYLNDRHYGTRVSDNRYDGKYKIGILHNTDSEHLSKFERQIEVRSNLSLDDELNRIESKLDVAVAAETGEEFTYWFRPIV
jgi:hypothetical protein